MVQSRVTQKRDLCRSGPSRRTPVAASLAQGRGSRKAGRWPSLVSPGGILCQTEARFSGPSALTEMAGSVPGPSPVQAL